MISVIIPVINEHEWTGATLGKLYNTAKQKPQVIIVDNGSQPHYKPFYDELVLRNDVNAGLIGSLAQAVPEASGDILVFMHNDVLLHEAGWDERIQKAFDDDPKLGIAGLFGGKGVYPNGGRLHNGSNMLGKTWGSSWEHHSNHFTGITSAAVLDGMVIIFRKAAVEYHGLPELPPHHWYDRILPLYFIERNWRCATIGIAYDHASGLTACREAYFQFAKKWCEDRGIVPPEGQSYDHQIYNAGAKYFEDTYGHRLPLFVNDDYLYQWSA